MLPIFNVQYKYTIFPTYTYINHYIDIDALLFYSPSPPETISSPRSLQGLITLCTHFTRVHVRVRAHNPLLMTSPSGEPADPHQSDKEADKTEGLLRVTR